MSKYELELSYSNPDFWYSRTLKIDSSPWRRLRKVVLERDNYTCSFCDIRLSKWMTVDHIDGDGANNDLSNLRLNCRACDRIRHSGLAGMNGEIDLMISKLSQVEIVIRSHAFFIRHGRNPLPHEIDKDCVIVPDSSDLAPFEVADWRKRGYKKEYQDHKGYFTNSMWFGYLEFVIND